MKPVEDVGSPLTEVDDPRRQPPRVQAEAQDVDRRLEQSRVDPSQEGPGDVVGRNERPVPVDSMGGVGSMAGQHEVDRVARRLEGGVIEAPLRVGGGVPGGNEQGVALAQWNLEMVGKP